MPMTTPRADPQADGAATPRVLIAGAGPVGLAHG